MNKLTRADLLSLEQYAERRGDFRREIIAHKKHRRVALGPNATLYFEDRMTMRYQIQEVLRVEKIFEPDAIEEELAAYNPLIPDGTNWKATFMVEFEDEQERRAMLAKLIGIERAIWIQIGDLDKVAPIANEDLSRETEEKTSAVHFLRFELTGAMRAAVKAGADVQMGVSHNAYTYESGVLPGEIARALAADLDASH